MKSWTSFRRLYLIIVAVSGFLLAPVVLTSYFWNVWPQTSEELVRYTIQIPSSFELTDQNGRIVKQSTLIGKPTVVFFGFSNCPDVCPTTLSNLTELMDRLGPDADRLNVLFISVDPERDTQERLASYLTSFDERIIGLTGSSKVIAEMTKALGAYYQKRPQKEKADGHDHMKSENKDSSYSVDHSTIVYLFNDKGNFIALLNFQRESYEEAVEKLRKIIG